MNNSSRYFENKDCEYYPCHQKSSPDEPFNCLFCYCPLYDTACEGNYTVINYNGSTIKDCSNCMRPHRPENYDKIIAELMLARGF